MELDPGASLLSVSHSTIVWGKRSVSYTDFPLSPVLEQSVVWDQAGSQWVTGWKMWRMAPLDSVGEQPGENSREQRKRGKLASAADETRGWRGGLDSFGAPLRERNSGNTLTHGQLSPPGNLHDNKSSPLHFCDNEAWISCIFQWFFLDAARYYLLERISCASLTSQNIPFRVFVWDPLGDRLSVSVKKTHTSITSMDGWMNSRVTDMNITLLMRMIFPMEKKQKHDKNHKARNTK